VTEEIARLLEEHEGGFFTPIPAQPGALEEFEAVLGERLPEDIREVFTRWGGGTVTVPGLTPLGLGPVGELLDSARRPGLRRRTAWDGDRRRYGRGLPLLLRS
jgi:hypothetical protein